MIIGGLQKLSLSDFPGRISAIIFTRGCNFRCPWCHNPELVDPARYSGIIPQDDALAFLSTRKTLLQGVVVTGGEPLLQDDLDDFLRKARAMGLAVKLDTNGSRPQKLARLLAEGLVDYVALDVKAPWGAYPRVTSVKADTDAVAESIQLLRERSVPSEIRTTYSPQFLQPEDLRVIASMIRGCEHFMLQAFRPSKTLDPSLLANPSPSAEEMEEARRVFESEGIPVRLR
jgi:pyruvate formate lyase activating enzyme